MHDIRWLDPVRSLLVTDKGYREQPEQDLYHNAQSPVSQDVTPFHCSHQMNLASIPSLSQLFIQNLTKLHFKATKRVK